LSAGGSLTGSGWSNTSTFWGLVTALDGGRGHKMSGAERYPLGFYLAVAANFFFFASFQWIYVTLPTYVQMLGGDAAQIGLAFGLFTLGAVALRPSLGRLIDRWGRKPVLLMGAVIFCLSPALYAVAPALWAFQVVRVFHGVGMAAFTTAYTALVVDLAPLARRGEAVGLSGVTNNLGLLFAPALGAYVQSQTGYAVHFLAAAAIAALAAVALLPVRERWTAKASLPGGHGLRAVARKRPVWVAALAGTGLAVAYGAVLSYLPPFAEERGLAGTGGYFAAFALAMMTAQALAGWLSDRTGRRAVAMPGLALVVLATAGLAMTWTSAGLLIAGAGLGLSWGLVRAGLDTSVVDAVEPEARGSALGFLYTCFDVGVGMGAFGLGVVAVVQGYAAAFFAAAAWAAVALAGYLALGRRAPTSQSGNHSL
jgi:MFS family permease